MKINYKDWEDEDFLDTDEVFVKMTKKAKTVHKEKANTIRIKRKNKEKERAFQEKMNSYNEQL